MNGLKNSPIKYLQIIIPSIIALIFIFLYINKNNELNKLNSSYKNSLENSRKEVIELLSYNNKLSDSLQNLKNVSMNYIYLPGYDVQYMKMKGLNSPVKDLISDLKKHRELIPYSGVHGGTMNFYGNNSIWILTSKWVLAYFEDGHISGYLLLEYDISNNGEISWRRIASMKS